MTMARENQKYLYTSLCFSHARTRTHVEVVTVFAPPPHLICVQLLGNRLYALEFPSADGNGLVVLCPLLLLLPSPTSQTANTSLFAPPLSSLLPLPVTIRVSEQAQFAYSPRLFFGRQTWPIKIPIFRPNVRFYGRM